ncbi:hypothetical protein AB0I81_16600 [Nonomuraea sp. NPDC050404]|uniref:hypothetical protein n=1 Tax=Nonomuraea sp. NPDC050404 TaxID=3155783 RepID=UPI0033C62C3C
MGKAKIAVALLLLAGLLAPASAHATAAAPPDVWSKATFSEPGQSAIQRHYVNLIDAAE